MWIRIFAYSNIICPSLIVFLSERCPNLNISILEGGEIDLMKKMKNGQIDLFLGFAVLDRIPIIMPSNAQGLNHNYQQIITRMGLHPARIYRTGNMLTGIHMVGK